MRFLWSEIDPAVQSRRLDDDHDHVSVGNYAGRLQTDARKQRDSSVRRWGVLGYRHNKLGIRNTHSPPRKVTLLPTSALPNGSVSARGENQPGSLMFSEPGLSNTISNSDSL